MQIISSIDLTSDQKYLLASDNFGDVYIWQLASIFAEHHSRGSETNQNNLVYRKSHRIRMSDQSIHRILIIKDNLFIASSNTLKSIALSTILPLDNKLEQNSTIFAFQAQFKDQVTCLAFQNELLVCVNNQMFTYDILQDNCETGQFDISETINQNIQSLVPIYDSSITQLKCFKNNQVAIGTNIGLIAIWNQTNREVLYVLKFSEKDQCLSPLIQMIYLNDTCQMISLHENYLVIWNTITEQEIIVKPVSGYIAMTCLGDKMLLAGQNRKIQLMDMQGEFIQNELQCSQDVVFQLSTNTLNDEHILISNGSGPFVDIYKSLSYTLTLSCL